MKPVVQLILNILRGLHLAVLIFTVTGWLLPPQFLWFFIVWIPLMVMQWQLNQGTCILTNLESALLARTGLAQAGRAETSPSQSHQIPAQSSTGESGKEEQQGQFIKSVIRALFGRVPSDQVLKYVINGLIWGCWGLACLRLYLHTR